MVDTSINILAIFMHHFKLNLIITESTRRIQEIKRNKTISDRTAKIWFAGLKGGALSVEIKPRSGPKHLRGFGLNCLMPKSS